MQKQSTTNNSYRHYNLPLTFPCISFGGKDWVLDDDYGRTKHFHNCIELGYCISGSGTLSVENSDFSFHAGDYCFIPENVTHKSYSAPGTESSWKYIYFDPYLMFQSVLPEAVLDDLLFQLSGCFGTISEDENNELYYLLSCIFNELHKKEPYYQDSLKGLFFSLLMLLKRNSKITYQSDYQWLYSAISYIRKNYHKKLSISVIARECCGFSESHFRQKFTDIMHINPLEYINHLRIRIACQHIYANVKPLNEIASEVGFPVLSSFNRNFHTLLGCSPSEWRKKQLQSYDVPEILTLDNPEIQDIFLR